MKYNEDKIIKEGIVKIVSQSDGLKYILKFKFCIGA